MPYQKEVRISRYYPDLVFPFASLIVEIDGDYWHARPKTQERDQRRDAVFQSLGWTVLHIWEHEIEADMLGCIDRIQQALWRLCLERSASW